MDEFLLGLLAVILVMGLGVGVPITLLVMIFKVHHHQQESSDELSSILRKLERELDDSKQLIRRMADQMATSFRQGAEEKPPEPEEARAPRREAEAPVEPGILAEVVTPPPVARPPALAASSRGYPFGEKPYAQADVQPPRVPSRFETAAKETLHKIWNWIIVGEEHRPEGVSIEFAVASNWLLRIGIVILVMGGGFFLRYSMEHGWIGPAGRVSLSILAGVGMLAAGTQMLGKKYHLMGQGLMGGGLALLYFAIFAAANLYNLIEVLPAFALMALVTLSAGVLAVRFNSVLLAVLGIIGGYGTPVMLRTGEVNFPGLFGYMLVLGVGVLGISYKKNWRLLSYLSFAANYFLFFAAMGSYEEKYFWQVMPFLTAFFVLFSTMVFIFNLANRQKSTLLEVLELWINAGIFFAVSYNLVRETYGKEWVAAITLGLAAFYIAHIYYFLVRKLRDRELLTSFMAMAAFFLAVTLPLVLSREWITASWALQALVMLWIAGRLDSQFLRHVAYLLYAIVLGRFCFLDLPSQYAGASLADMPMREYLWALVERVVMFGVPVASMAAGCWLLRRPLVEEGAAPAVEKANDIGQWIHQRWAVRVGIGVAVAMLFLYLHLELNRTLGYFYRPMRMPVLTLLWLGVCLLLVYEYLADRSRVLLGLLTAFVAGLLIKLFFFDLPGWNVASDMLYVGGKGDYFRDAAMRLIDFGAIVSFFAFAFFMLSGDVSARTARITLGWLAVAMAFIWSTLELNTFLGHFVEGLRAGGISILWSVFALGLILAGILKEIRVMRYVGLGLFAVVAWKVFFVDLARLEQLYRIVAFILLGILVLSGSFVYLKYRQTFAISSVPSEETEE